MQILIQPVTLLWLVGGFFNGVIALYLLARPRKTRAAWLLSVVFGMQAAMWLMLALDTSVVWDRMATVVPLRVPFLIFFYAVHLHFVYVFRGNPFAKEARVVIPLGYGLALLVSAHPVWAGITGLVTGLTPSGFGEGVTSFLFLLETATTLLLVWSLAVYLRKSVHSTRESLGQSVGFVRALLRPAGREAIGFIAFCLPWSIPLLGGFIETTMGGDSVFLFITILLNPALFILIYLTYAPEPTSIRVKLSGTALVATLAVLFALFLMLQDHGGYEPDDVRFPEGQTLRFDPRPEGGYRVEPLPLRTGISLRAEAAMELSEGGLGERLDVGDGTWTPLAPGFGFPFAGATYDTLYVMSSAPIVTLGAPLPRRDVLPFQFSAGPQPKLAPLLLPMAPPRGGSPARGAVYVRRGAARLTITWHEMSCCGTSEDRNTVQLALSPDGGFSFSYPRLDADVADAAALLPLIGVHPGGPAPLQPFRATREALAVPAGVGAVDNVGVRYRKAVHDWLLPFVWLLFIASVAILIGFPLLLRTSLTAPIERLLRGIRRVDQGERDVAVSVGAEDEVGRLARYFNRMTASLRDAEADLRAYAEHLEERVDERTAELQKEKAKTEQQAARLLELDEAKSRFFANVSHELRTPLTLLLGPLRDVAGPDRGLPARQIPAMRRSAERLLTLVDELLDLARLDAGRLRLRIAERDLVALTRRTVLAFASRAEREGLALGFEVALDAEEERIDAWVDAERYERVVSNLLTNAFKFTPSGGRVRVSLDVERGADEGSVVLTVRDTGEGIQEDLLPHVFERFRQGDDASTRRHEGAGIGLALVRELVELHGGEVTVESEVGFGSAFTVRLPLGKDHLDAEHLDAEAADEAGPDAQPTATTTDAAEDAVAQATNGGAEPLEVDEEDAAAVRTDATVLVVEDHDDMRAYLRDLLAPYYHVEEAGDGEAGLEAARRLAAEGRTPDLVISDVMMPGMDGYALCHALKADDALGHVPVVLLTARADEESKLEGLGEGADDYLSKPFSAEELLARCENLIEVRRRLRARFSGEVIVRPSDRVLDGAEVVVEREEAEWVEAVRAVCEVHIADANFGVDWLADELGASTRTLRRRLKAASGLTPGAFLRTIRLECAAQLLEQGSEVGDVAAAVGYSETASFSRAFSQGFGVPPSEYAQLRRRDHRP